MKTGQTLTITIRTENDAFSPEPGREVARILQRVAKEFANGLDFPGKTIRDANGNIVGVVDYQ